MAFAAVAVLVAADAAYVALRLRGALRPIAASFESARSDFAKGRFDQAKLQMDDALSRTTLARELLRHPSARIAGWVPWVDENLLAVDALSTAAQGSAQAGLAAVKAAAAAGAENGRFSEALYENGRVKFEAVDRATPHIEEARRLLAGAARVLSKPLAPRLGSVQDALARARDEIGAASQAAKKGEAVLSLMPRLLGRGESRRYFLAFQTPSESRGGGGLVGLYGLLDVEDGRTELTTIGYIGDLITKFERVESPRWFEEHYGSLKSTREWQQANESPNFPVVAEVFLKMFERVRGESLDGVIAMDPLALQEFIRSTGPLRADGINQPVGPDNAAEVILHDSYLKLPNQRAHTTYISQLVEQFWDRVQRGNFDVPEFAQAVARAARTQHFKIYSRDEADRKVLADLEVDGDYERFGPNVQMLFHNNFAANKVDWFLNRRQDTEIRLNEDGEARVVTKVALENPAPSGPQGIFLGDPDFKDYPVGTNGMWLNFLIPKESTIYDFRINRKRALYILHEDNGFPVAWDLLEIPSGQKASAELEFGVERVLDSSRQGTRFRWTFVPQALVRPDDLSVVVYPPEGSRWKTTDGEPLEGPYEFSGKLEEKVVIDLILERL